MSWNSRHQAPKVTRSCSPRNKYFISKRRKSFLSTSLMVLYLLRSGEIVAKDLDTRLGHPILNRLQLILKMGKCSVLSQILDK